VKVKNNKQIQLETTSKTTRNK